MNNNDIPVWEKYTLTIEESQFDDLIGMETGASIIFGNTGGVMEAAAMRKRLPRAFLQESMRV